MALPEFVQGIAERLESSASVKRVYGDPITAEGRTIIPVARIGYGFGGGTGNKPGAHGEEKTGGGAGGGAGAVPIGLVEISPAGTRFIPFTDKKKMAAVFAAGLLAGLLIGRRD